MVELLAKLGFRIIYQSRASRGAFDLLAILDDKQIGIQCKRGQYPFYLKKSTVNEMQFWAKKLNWIPVVALDSEKDVNFYRIEDLRETKKYSVIDENSVKIDTMLDVVYVQ